MLTWCIIEVILEIFSLFDTSSVWMNFILELIKEVGVQSPHSEKVTTFAESTIQFCMKVLLHYNTMVRPTQ